MSSGSTHLEAKVRRFISVSAPSNIALVKYMGKMDEQTNLPANASLSLTLQKLCTKVDLTVVDYAQNPGQRRETVWESASRESEFPTSLSSNEIARLDRHVARVLERGPGLLQRYGFKTTDVPGLIFRTTNTFPASSGIASSASSFAGITTAVLFALVHSDDLTRLRQAWADAASAMQGFSVDLVKSVAALSREGSGSSCRSFFGPWVQWSGTDVERIPAATGLAEYGDLVLVVSTEKKSISSSEAHGRVMTSPLWNGRPARADERVRTISHAITAVPEWGPVSVNSTIANSAADLVWQEAWEMHSLFHTASLPFTYWAPATLEALRWADESGFRQAGGMVTLDAGPNPHFIAPLSTLDLWAEKLTARFSGLRILRDRQGSGVQVNEVRGGA